MIILVCPLDIMVKTGRTQSRLVQLALSDNIKFKISMFETCGDIELLFGFSIAIIKYGPDGVCLKASSKARYWLIRGLEDPGFESPQNQTVLVLLASNVLG